MASRLRLALALAVAAAVLGYGMVCATAALQVKEFRRSPRPGLVTEIFRSEWPHNLLARSLLFVVGSRQYNIDVREWVYLYAKPADTAFNRWLLARNLIRGFPAIVSRFRGEQPSEEEIAETLRGRAELLNSYPVQPTPQLSAYARNALERGEVYYLPILLRDQTLGNRTAVGRWLFSYFESGQHNDLLILYRRLIFKQPDAPTARLLQMALASNTEPAQYMEMVSVAMAAADAALARQIDPFYELLTAMIAAENYAVPALLGRLASLPDQQSRAVDFVMTHLSALTDDDLASIVSYSYPHDNGTFARDLYNRFLQLETMRSHAVLHGIAHESLTTAEALAMRLLSEADSTPRKNTIIVLANHESAIAAPLLDQAFSGEAPRTEKLRLSSYAHGSVATDTYIRHTGHDYQQTGKTWPPSSTGDGLFQDQETAWSKFVQDYPWFPGTDDAYYKLCYAQYRQGDYDTALATLDTYFKIRERPDRDAEPYLVYARQHVLLKGQLQTEQPLAPMQAVVRTNLAAAVLDETPDLDGYIASLDWFLADAQRLEYLRSSASESPGDAELAMENLQSWLRNARSIAVIARARPIGQRLFAIVSFLRSNRSLESTTTLSGTLYGTYVSPSLPRPEYVAANGTASPDELSLAYRAAVVKRLLSERIDVETDQRRRFDLFIWAAIHSYSNLDTSFREITAQGVSLSDEVWNEFSGSEAGRELLDTLGIEPAKKTS